MGKQQSNGTARAKIGEESIRVEGVRNSQQMNTFLGLAQKSVGMVKVASFDTEPGAAVTGSLVRLTREN